MPDIAFFSIGGLLVLLAFFSPIVLLIDLVRFLDSGERWLGPVARAILDCFLIVIPYILFAVDEFRAENDCCRDTAFFSPVHRLSAFVLMGLCIVAYMYSSFRSRIAPPVVEVAVNCFLLLGLVFSVFMILQSGGWTALLALYVAIDLSFITALARNHQLFMRTMEIRMEEGFFSAPHSRLVGFCWTVLRLRPLQKFPLLLLLCLPLLVIMTALLMLFGQRPDALVKAFTDTYRHGLSQIDSQCDGVVCPSSGHFLCTIAANGHTKWVKPLRTGVRGGKMITCNRQLLVSNAFEEWLEQRWPSVHGSVRRFYNKVGAGIHRHYGMFKRKWVSDLIYVLMKPLEWGFLLVLYLVDRDPETRIAQQYLRREDREKIKMGLASI